MTPHALQPLILCAAFWLALWLHDRRAPRQTWRLAAALLAGAVCARIGPALLFETVGAARFDPLGSVSVLFLPLGILLFAPRPAAFASLPLPLALARTACLVAGCCHGRVGALLPISDAAALCLLHRGLARLPSHWIPAAFMIAFGALRICESDWRDVALEASARVAPSGVAALWMTLGIASTACVCWRSGKIQRIRSRRVSGLRWRRSARGIANSTRDRAPSAERAIVAAAGGSIRDEIAHAAPPRDRRVGRAGG